MEYGYIKTATASFDVQVACVSANVESMLRLMRQARERQVELLVFPELCVTGYSCGDLFLTRRLLNQAQEGLKQLAAASAGSCCLVVAGAPICHNEKLYNCAVFIQDGKLRGIVPKSYIPGYREFYEKRWFAPGRKIKTEEEMGVPFGVLERCAGGGGDLRGPLGGGQSQHPSLLKRCGSGGQSLRLQ